MRVDNAVELEFFGRFTAGNRNLTKCHDVTGTAQAYFGF